MTDANALRARFAPFALRYAERKALDAGNPEPALRGARRRALWRVALFVLLAAYFVFLLAMAWDVNGLSTAVHAFFIAVAAYHAVDGVAQFRRLTALRAELGAS